MRKEQYMKTGNDESYTYPNLIYPLLPYIEEFKKKLHKNNITIWCPFDVEEETQYNEFKVLPSHYPKIFKEAGFNVISSHIANGQDFFTYEPQQEWDIIISNCPFKDKAKFFKRALEFDKPFCILNTAAWLNDNALYKLFGNGKQMQLIIPNKRSKFFNEHGCIGKQPSFKAIYYAYKFLQNSDI